MKIERNLAEGPMTRSPEKLHRALIVILLTLGLVRAGLAASPPAGGVVLDIDPSPENQRNSEGAFVTLADGRILFCYTQFYGGTGDHHPARIVGIESSDRGRTWSPPRVVIDNEGEANVMSVSLLRLASGKLAMFYLRKNSWLDCRPWMRTSADEGRTWSDPVLMVAAPGYFVLNNDRVIQLTSGRIVAPVGFHRARQTDPSSSRSFDSRAIALWYLSDDDGLTWREADSWWGMPVVSRSGLQEPGVVELADRTLLGWARTDRGSQYGFASRDAGATWSAPTATSMESPLSPASLKRVPGSAELLAIYNDHSGRFPFPPGKRSPLVAAISRDGGRTWPLRTRLEEDPDGWYCYTAIHFDGDAVLLGYCAGDSKVGRLNRLRIRRIEMAAFRSE
jgi:sialidase-1